MKNLIKNFLTDEAGASAAEYALILAVIGVAIGAAALALGQNVGLAISNASENVADCGDAAANGTAPTDFVTDTPATC